MRDALRENQYMNVSTTVRCEGCCGCADVVHERFSPPHWHIEPELVRLVMVSEAPPLDPDDWFDAGDGALFAQTTILAFQEAGASVARLDDLIGMGVYLTTAVKCAKATSVISARTITACSSLLEAELASFPDVRALMLMGDAAIKSVNAIARRCGEPRVIPAGSTYKLRGGRYVWRRMRVFPSYVQSGPAFFVEKSKRRMIAEDIAAALAHARS